MNYQEFKDYLVTFLWKTGDLELINNLDTLIVMGTQELNRLLDLSRRNTELAEISVSAEIMDLPADFRHMIYLGIDGCGFSNTTLWNLENYTGGSPSPLYHTSGGKLYTRSTSYPFTAKMQYRTNLPDYKAADTSWMADDFLDVYVYTVLKHSAPFLREDERIPVWQSFSVDGIGTMIAEDKHNIEYGGSPTIMQITRTAP